MPDSNQDKVQRELFVRSFFDVSPPAELAEMLAARMRDRRFEAGEIIYERDQPSGPVFFVTSGTVELGAPGEEPWVFHDKSLIGAIDANAGRPHPRTARALTRVRAVEIHFDEYVMLLEDFFDFARDMVIQGAHRTHETALRLAPDGVLSPPPRPTGRWLGEGPLDEVQRLMALRSSFGFQSAPVQALVNLARSARELRLSAGEAAFGAGDDNRGVDIVIDGRLEVTHDEPRMRSGVGPGQFALGVLSMAPEPYAFSGRAETDAVLLRIRHEDVFDAMEEHIGLLRAWWRYMGEENRRAREELARRGLGTSDLASPRLAAPA